MILPIFGFSTSIPSDYNEVIRRLKMLGLSPTGNEQLDKSRLQSAIKNQIEKFELKKAQEEKTEDNSERNALEEQRNGAIALGELNKFFLGLL